MFLVPLILGVLFAIGCQRKAKLRGRRPGLWAALGFFFGVFALLALTVMPVLTPREAAA